MLVNVAGMTETEHHLLATIIKMTDPELSADAALMSGSLMRPGRWHHPETPLNSQWWACDAQGPRGVLSVLCLPRVTLTMRTIREG